jgi:phage terminase large subunit GpA-like protein
MQQFRWKDDDGNYRLVWESDETGKVTSIHYVCVNGCAIEPHQKIRMMDPESGAGWFQKFETKDEEGRVTSVSYGDSLEQILSEHRHNGEIGFEINALSSPFAGCTWKIVAEKFIKASKEAKAGKPELLKTFVNTMLGETWDTKNEKPEVEGLEARVEPYAADVPLGVLLLTAGVDTQPDRLECSIWGWGIDDECWLIYHEILWGSPAKQQVWEELKELLSEQFWCEREDANGNRLIRTIDAACIDAGGHNAEDVKTFTKAHRGRKWLAIFGKPTGAKEAIVTHPTRVNSEHGSALLWAVGSSLIKAKLFSRLKVAERGPGYVHFPKDETVNTEYFKQLTAEKQVKKQKKFHPKDQHGYSDYVFKKIRDRNEALDCFVYAFAAKEHLRPNFSALLQKENLHCAPKNDTLYSESEEKKQRYRPSAYKRTQGGFVSSWQKK